MKSNYEIMLILDPKSDIQETEKLVKEVFQNDEVKFEKLPRTELAYEINNSLTATYVLINVKTEGKNIKEFVRRVNIAKFVWRHLAINLDSERAVKTLTKVPRTFVRREHFDNNRENSRTERTSNSATTQVTEG